ncbi:lysophospholipid acyltransferase family protein [Labedaea rhizosphaerae]|uniref:1-acyl-sn-glycerol-3-phosphate acyltransferase n=1 Tax=Labedaea rhizosphaerae TaxID=598644 RepID=A0A4R6SEI6_LABRH|nr:lysophospholipid acyltransferase family protein [Labedaea rhizosphaerae]TDP97545.1 1-acyl-sn-glycerol-3-phosphate acyltransferase [Labedaea rhizosphaerae]
MSTHAWFPRSPCGPECRAGGEPTVGAVRAAGRMIAAAFVVLLAVIVSPVLAVLPKAAARLVFRAVLLAFGVRLRVRGELVVTPGRGALVVVNHISWLDAVAVNAVRPMRAVAKKEIGAWPVIGRVVAAAGTVFLDREGLRALPGTVAELATALRGGAVVTANPEGTTWCGAALGRFTPALFQAALDAGVPVRPVALRFTVDGAPTPAPSFVGADTLIDSVRRVARLRGLVLEVVVLDEIAPGTVAHRRDLAALASASVTAALLTSGTTPGSRVPSQAKSRHFPGAPSRSAR